MFRSKMAPSKKLLQFHKIIEQLRLNINLEYSEYDGEKQKELL